MRHNKLDHFHTPPVCTICNEITQRKWISLLKRIPLLRLDTCVAFKWYRKLINTNVLYIRVKKTLNMKRRFTGKTLQKKVVTLPLALHWHSKVTVQEILICYTCTHSLTLKEIATIPSAHLKIRLTCAIKHCIRFNQLMHRGNPLSGELQRAARGIEGVLQLCSVEKTWRCFPLHQCEVAFFRNKTVKTPQKWSDVPRVLHECRPALALHITERLQSSLSLRSSLSLHDICTAHVFH